jgi:hypothetical protein
MIPLQLVTRWNVYGVAPNRGYIQVNKNEGIHEMPATFAKATLMMAGSIASASAAARWTAGSDKNY